MEFPVCTYCGEAADTLDHLSPRSFEGGTAKLRGGSDPGETVPACRECNSALGSTLCKSVEEKAGVVHKFLKRRYGRVKSPVWADEELSTLGPTARSAVLAHISHSRINSMRIHFSHAVASGV